MRKSPGSRPRPRRPNHGATAARMTSTTRTVSSHFNMIELYTWSTPNGRKVSIMLEDRKSTRLNSSHGYISYAVFCLKKKKKIHRNIDKIHNLHLTVDRTTLIT